MSDTTPLLNDYAFTGVNLEALSRRYTF